MLIQGTRYLTVTYEAKERCLELCWSGESRWASAPVRWR